MNSEQDDNKELASLFFARFSAKNVAGALDILADDLTWWIAGDPALGMASAGTHDKEQIARIFYRMAGRVEQGLKMTVKSSIAEGDKVALEVQSHGVLDNGRVYRNEYHTLMRIRDGKICEVREYLDTQHVFATWFQP